MQVPNKPQPVAGPDSQPTGQPSDSWSAGALEPKDQPGQAQPVEPAVEPAEPTEKKKRYYSPNEVMKKKGCIGCGGMALALALMAAALVAVLVII